MISMIQTILTPNTTATTQLKELMYVTGITAGKRQGTLECVTSITYVMMVEVGQDECRERQQNNTACLFPSGR